MATQGNCDIDVQYHSMLSVSVTEPHAHVCRNIYNHYKLNGSALRYSSSVVNLPRACSADYLISPSVSSP